MVPLIIALPRALHFWTRASCHGREVSKLRPAVRVAKIMPRWIRRSLATKVRAWTIAIPEIRRPVLLRARVLASFITSFRSYVPPGLIGKLTTRTEFRLLSRRSVSRTGLAHPAVPGPRIPRAKLSGMEVRIVAELLRTLPVKLPVLHMRECGGLAIRVAKLSTRERWTRLPCIRARRGRGRTRFLGDGGTADQQNSGE